MRFSLMSSSSILGCESIEFRLFVPVVLVFIRFVVWESFLLRFSFYSRSFCLVLYCVYSCDQSTHYLPLPYYVSFFMFFGGIPSIDAFVCAIIMHFHASMCINACPLLSALLLSRPFLFPGIPIPVCIRGVSRPPRLLLSRSSGWWFSSISACILGISRSGSSLRGFFRTKCILLFWWLWLFLLDTAGSM